MRTDSSDMMYPVHMMADKSAVLSMRRSDAEDEGVRRGSHAMQQVQHGSWLLEQEELHSSDFDRPKHMSNMMS